MAIKELSPSEMLNVIKVSSSNDGILRLIGCYIPKTENYKSKKIQKALSGSGKWFYFIKGFDIQNQIEEGYKTIKVNEDFLDDVKLYSNQGINISISAIVGQNGSGKSSLCEILLRILNNYAVACLGELPRKNEVSGYIEHLHYIDNVNASMTFYQDGLIYMIDVEDRNVSLYLYNKSQFDVYQCEYFVKLLSEEEFVKNNFIERDVTLKEFISQSFYSLFVNYSLYSYNYQEFKEEFDEDDRITNYDKEERNNSFENTHWLHSLFHKNDGYSTPIVIHPGRKDGIININEENNLAGERLINFLFVEYEGEHPFRTINSKLKATSLSIRLKNARYLEERSLDKIHNSFNIDKKNMDNLSKIILNFWYKKFQIDKNKISCNFLYHNCAENYIVYKTLKIIINKYIDNIKLGTLNKENPTDFIKILNEIANDHSNLTVKIRRTLNDLKFGIYSSYSNEIIESKKDFSLEELGGKMKINIPSYELLPPPFLFTDIYFTDTINNEVVSFFSLSSGEKQIAYMLTSIQYHLFNLNIKWNGSKTDVHYKYVNIVLDEIESYFHPDLQRQFVKFLLDAVCCVGFCNIKGINIIMVTHSPFILSDLPAKNILIMGNNDYTINHSLGANIGDLLSDSFFMESTIGEYTLSEIQKVVSSYREIVRNGDNNIVFDKIKAHLLEKYISDPYIRKILSGMIHEIENNN